MFEYRVATVLAKELILGRPTQFGGVVAAIELQSGPEGFDDLQLSVESDGATRTVHAQCRYRQQFTGANRKFAELIARAAAAISADKDAFESGERRLAVIVDSSSRAHEPMRALCRLARTSGELDRFRDAVESHQGDIRSRWDHCVHAAGDLQPESLHRILASLEVHSFSLDSDAARDSLALVNDLADEWAPRDDRHALNLANALFRLMTELGPVAGLVDLGVLRNRLGSHLPSALGANTRRERLVRKRDAGHRRTVSSLRAIGLADDEAESLAEQVLAIPPSISVSEPVTVITGPMGIGKTTELERLHRAAIDAALDHPLLPIPVFVSAAEIGHAALRSAVSDHIEGLGDPSRVGVHLVIDGLDEAGTEVSELTGRIETMRADWPNSVVLLGTRPQATPHGVPVSAVAPLTPEDATRLMERVEPRVPKLAWQREHLREILRCPLFAITFALDRREGRGAGFDEAQLVESVGRRALRDLGCTADEDFGLLVRLACRIVSSGGRLVDPRDLDASAAQIGRLSRLRIVLSADGKMSFHLAALTEWFAAHALLHDAEMLARSVSSPASAHRWRYVFVQALRQGSGAKVDKIMATLLSKMPGTAAWVYDAAKTSDADRRSTPLTESAEEAGNRIRGAAISWLEPWPLLIGPSTGEVIAPTLGISIEQLSLTTAWLTERDESGKRVVPLPLDLDPLGTPEGIWNGIHSGTPENGELWPWAWARWALQQSIDQLLTERELLASIELCHPELAWDYAHNVLNRGATTQSDPIRPADIEEAITRHRDSSPESYDVIVGGYHGTWSVTEAANFVADLEALGIDEIVPPWAPADTTGPSTGAWWTPEQLRTRLVQATRTALDIYQAVVDNHLPLLAPELHTYQLLPARIVGQCTPADHSLGTRGDPRFRWHIEPLPAGSDNEASWSIVARDNMSRDEDWEMRAARVRELRGDLADRLKLSTHYGESAIISSTPASSLALDLLWGDLSHFKWVSGPAPHHRGAPSIPPRLI